MANKPAFLSPAIPEFDITGGSRPISIIIKDPKYNSDPDVQSVAIKADPSAVLYFQATRVQWFDAIKRRPSLWIVSPYIDDYEISTYVLKNNPDLVLRLKNPKDDHCLIAIKSQPLIVTCLPKPKLIMWITAVQQKPDLIVSYQGELPPQIVQAAISTDPSCIKYLKSITETNAMAVIKTNPNLMLYIVNKLDCHQIERIIAIYPGAIQYVDVQTPKIQKIAIRAFPGAFQFCHQQTNDVVELALELDPNNIQYVEHQTIAMARDALKRGAKPTMIFHSILEELALEKRVEQAKLIETKRIEAEKAAQAKQNEQIKFVTEILSQPSFELTPAQKQLLPQILRSDLDDAIKTETIKLLLKPQ